MVHVRDVGVVPVAPVPGERDGEGRRGELPLQIYLWAEETGALTFRYLGV